MGQYWPHSQNVKSESLHKQGAFLKDWCPTEHTLEKCHLFLLSRQSGESPRGTIPMQTVRLFCYREEITLSSLDIHSSGVSVNCIIPLSTCYSATLPRFSFLEAHLSYRVSLFLYFLGSEFLHAYS